MIFSPNLKQPPNCFHGQEEAVGDGGEGEEVEVAVKLDGRFVHRFHHHGRRADHTRLLVRPLERIHPQHPPYLSFIPLPELFGALRPS